MGFPINTPTWAELNDYELDDWTGYRMGDDEDWDEWHKLHNADDVQAAKDRGDYVDRDDDDQAYGLG